MSDLPTEDRPKVAEVFRPRPEEELDRDGLAAAGSVIAPALVAAAVAMFFLPMFDRLAPLIALGLIALAPIALTVAWRPGASATRARRATLITAILLGLAAGGLGLQANRCVAEPMVVGLTGVALFVGTLLVATWIGRGMARGSGLVSGIVAAGAIGTVGFYQALLIVGEKVFVLC